jgi:hypothetical protein
VRRDPGKLDAVRGAMAELEGHILRANAAGVTPARIARITRLEPEMVVRMLDDHGAGRDGAGPTDVEPSAGGAPSPTGG